MVAHFNKISRCLPHGVPIASKLKVFYCNYIKILVLVELCLYPLFISCFNSCIGFLGIDVSLKTVRFSFRWNLRGLDLGNWLVLSCYRKSDRIFIFSVLLPAGSYCWNFGNGLLFLKLCQLSSSTWFCLRWQMSTYHNLSFMHKRNPHY